MARIDKLIAGFKKELTEVEASLKSALNNKTPRIQYAEALRLIITGLQRARREALPSILEQLEPTDQSEHPYRKGSGARLH
jgi:hypothetical protein